MSDTAKNDNPKLNRPLSPHLQVYRLPMTALMSISHRITGVILSGGLLIVAAFIIAAAAGPEIYNLVAQYATHPYVTAFFFAWSFVLYYHLCNGVRHLFWDMGCLLDKETAITSGWIVLVATAGLTAVTWYVAANGWGFLNNV